MKNWGKLRIVGLIFLIMISMSNLVASNSDFLRVPAGNFTMGDITRDLDSAHLPLRNISINEFYISKYELTNRQLANILQYAYNKSYLRVNARNITLQNNDKVLVELLTFGAEIKFENSTFIVRTGRDNYPAAWISWYGGLALSNWASEMDGLTPVYNLTNWSWERGKNGYRLLSEAEWEYASRGGLTGYRFPWGNTTSHVYANYRSNETIYYDLSPTRGYHPNFTNDIQQSSPVGYFSQNGFGIYDSSGNVWEWVWDWYGNYNSTDLKNPIGSEAGITKVFRGGSWRTTAERTLVATRYGGSRPTDTIYDVGIRFAVNNLSNTSTYHPADFDRNRQISANEISNYIGIYFLGTAKLLNVLYAMTIVQSGGNYSYVDNGYQVCENSPQLCWIR